MNKVVILSENSCHFVNFFRFTYCLFSSHLEINHVIQEPTEINQNTCRPPIFSQVDGLYYNTNMCSRGIQLSGGMGREMANLIVSGCTDVDMFSYDINRYYAKQNTYIIQNNLPFVNKNCYFCHFLVIFDIFWQTFVISYI